MNEIIVPLRVSGWIGSEIRLPENLSVSTPPKRMEPLPFSTLKLVEVAVMCLVYTYPCR